MKKRYLFTAVMFLWNTALFSQIVLFEYNFDSYTAGQYLAAQSDDWRTWSGTTGGSDDGLVTTDYALSAPNSVIIQNDLTDLVLLLGDKTEGQFEVIFHIFIETGSGGYYNYLHKFDGDSSEWAMDILFNENNTGYVRDPNYDEVATFFYTKDAWVECKLIVDLDGDEAELHIDGSLVYTWQWSFGELKQLGAVDFFSATPSGIPSYYIDNVSFIDVSTVGVDENNLSSCPGQYILKNNYPNPFNPATTISFTIQNAGNVSLDIYNTNGQKIRSLINSYLSGGDYAVIWNGMDNRDRPVPSGFYFYRLKCWEFNSMKKMVLIK
jgi:hypothetical protein